MAAFNYKLMRYWATALVFCSSLLAGCQSAQEQDSVLTLSLVASEDVNPDLNLRASPILIWVMQLSDDEDFNHAEFFTLVARPGPVALHGVLSRRSLMLLPGEIKQMRLPLDPKAHYIALVAEFRDLARSVWRFSYPLDMKQRDALRIHILHQSLVVSAKDGEAVAQSTIEAKHGG